MDGGGGSSLWNWWRRVGGKTIILEAVKGCVSERLSSFSKELGQADGFQANLVETKRGGLAK